MMQFFSFIASVLVQALFLSVLGDADSYGLVNKAVVVGSSVQFHCDVNSSDSLRVEFYKLGAILPEPELIWNFDSVGKTHFGSRLNVTVESCRQGPTCVIEIQNAQMNDAGSVVCRKVGQVAGYAASISVIGSELNCSTNETVCEDRMYNVSVSCELIYAGSFVPSVRCGVSGDLLMTGTSTNVSYLDYNKTTASFFGIALALKVANKSRIKCQLNFSNASQSVPFPPIRTHSHATNLPTYSSHWQSSTLPSIMVVRPTGFEQRQTSTAQSDPTTLPAKTTDEVGSGNISMTVVISTSVNVLLAVIVIIVITVTLIIKCKKKQRPRQDVSVASHYYTSPSMVVSDGSAFPAFNGSAESTESSSESYDEIIDLRAAVLLSLQPHVDAGPEVANEVAFKYLRLDPSSREQTALFHAGYDTLRSDQNVPVVSDATEPEPETLSSSVSQTNNTADVKRDSIHLEPESVVRLPTSDASIESDIQSSPTTQTNTDTSPDAVNTAESSNSH